MPAPRLRALLRLTPEPRRLSGATAVFAAVKDVQDSLSNIASARTRTATVVQRVAIGKRAVEIAVKAFQIGVADFTTVIAVQQSLNQANEDLVQVRAEQATYLVALDKALGGGYEANGTAQVQTTQVAEGK
jgi:outer membrane protein TolC